MKVSISLTDPDVTRVDCDGGVWICGGLDLSQRATLSSAGPDRDVAEQLLRGQRDAVVILVESQPEGAASLTAWRGILAGADVFYARLPDGSLYVSDHYRNAVAAVPVADRAPEPASLVEHYLTGWVFDDRSYSRGVGRLGRGERLECGPLDGEVTTAPFDRLAPIVEPGAEADAVDRVERLLEVLLTQAVDEGADSLGFSGGVDSTLLASLLPDDFPLLTMIPDSPEFSGETAYARDAAAQLGRSIVPVPFPEADYVCRLEETIDRLGTPPLHYVMPAFLPLYERAGSALIIGEGADTVFGSGRGMQRVSGMFGHRAGLALLATLQRFPSFVGRRAKQIRGYATRFAASPDSTDGLGARSLIFGDTSLVERIAGKEAIDEVLESQLVKVHERADVEPATAPRFYQHLERRQLRHLIADLAFLDRHIAHSYGKRAVQPFIKWQMVSEALRLPVRDRYVRGLHGKWVLKEILKRRVPDYPIKQRKFATGLPFERYYTDGPLAGIWDAYPVPDFIGSDFREAVTKTPTAVTWNAVTHSIWSERIEKNAALEPLPATLAYEAVSDSQP